MVQNGANDPQEYLEDDYDDRVSLANARLIAAAPLMFEALVAAEGRDDLIREFAAAPLPERRRFYREYEAACQRARELRAAALAAARPPVTPDSPPETEAAV